MSDETKRKGQKPVLSLGEALHVLEECWGFEAASFSQIKVLDSYDDCNFFVEADGSKYLMKCYNGVESDNPSIIEAQTAMMDLLSRNGVATSRTVKCLQTGGDTAWPTLRIFDRSSRTCAVRVCQWVEGAPLVGHATQALLVDAGRLLGKIHAIFDAHSFDHPGLHRYHQWDQQNTADLTTFTPSVLNDQRRQLVERVIARFNAEVVAVQAGLRRSALQADFNDANIVMTPPGAEGQPGELGVIDYGDIVYGWLVSDVAIGAAYATVSSYGKTHPFVAAALLVHGFVSVFPLTELEKQLLPLLAVCRLTTSVVLGAFSYQQQPENTYLLLHAEPAWASLEALTAAHLQDDIRALFRTACDPLMTEAHIVDLALAAESKIDAS
eukprot:m.33060 g.33060  ORF g.33060 m.33060 type:complete len:382 (-) comp4968_c0_seq1:23-1168(-)